MYGLALGLVVGLASFGLRRAGYDGWHALLTTVIFVAVVDRLSHGLAESR